MKLKALSNYDGDKSTRFGDCILIYDLTSMIVYDCGHGKHAEYVESFLQKNVTITSVSIVVSHNDSDHTNGVCSLLEWLSDQGKYNVTVYTHQYLKHSSTILKKVDDGRRNKDSISQAILIEFDNIKKIIEKAQELNISAQEALDGVCISTCTIVGPTADEFTDVATKAIDNRVDNKIGEGDAAETVMNAASVQLKCTLDDGKTLLLCGDASPDYLKNLMTYDIIQLPHHGQGDDAKAIFGVLGGHAYSKDYLISDNTGSAPNSGGSEDIVKYMKDERYRQAYNTKDKIIDLPIDRSSAHSISKRRTSLGDLDSI